MKSVYYPKSLESGYKKNCWAYLPLQVHQWREGIKGNEQLLSTYCTQWTISDWILLWNWGSGRLSNLARNMQLLSWRSGPNTKSLTPKLLLFSWSNSWLTWWGVWYSLHIWVRKRLTFYWLLFTVFPSGWNSSEPHTCFLSGPQSFAVPLPRIPSLLPFHLLCFPNQPPPPGSCWAQFWITLFFPLWKWQCETRDECQMCEVVSSLTCGGSNPSSTIYQLCKFRQVTYVSEPRVAHL